MVSVIIPVRNGAATITQQLAALGAQRLSVPWEVLVIDNGSTDATVDLVRRHAPQVAELRVIDASDRPGSSFARNQGAQAARGDLLLFCDADDVVAPGWIDAMAEAALSYDIVTGPQDARTLNAPDVQQWRPPRPRALPQNGFLPYAPSCNIAVWADVYQRTGGFDERYPQAHDVEWSWRAQLAGFTLGFAPRAVVQYRYRDDLRGLARQAYRAGVDAARLYHDYRSYGMRRPPLLGAVRVWAWLVGRLPYLTARATRGTWVRRSCEALGRLSGSIQMRVVFL
jgi:glycosyltransferase involved in cell wall biosynthesis